MAPRDSSPPDLVESRAHPEPSWRPGTAQGRRRLSLGLNVVVLLILAVVAARTMIDDAEKRTHADEVGLKASALVPFGGGPGGWSGLLEIRNVGSSPVFIVDVDLPQPAVLLGSHGLPLRIGVRSTGLVTMRLRLDCTAGVTAEPQAVPAIEVRARTVHGRQLTQRVAFRDLAALVSQLARDQCGIRDGGTAQPLGVTYERTQFRGGAIETTVLVRNAAEQPVTVLAVTGASGWPGSTQTEPSTLPATVPAGRAMHLRVPWEVSACPRIEADDVISSLRIVLDMPDEAARVGVFDLGAGFTRDFIRYYRLRCP